MSFTTGQSRCMHISIIAVQYLMFSWSLAGLKAVVKNLSRKGLDSHLKGGKRMASRCLRCASAMFPLLFHTPLLIRFTEFLCTCYS